MGCVHADGGNPNRTCRACEQEQHAKFEGEARESWRDASGWEKGDESGTCTPIGGKRKTDLNIVERGAGYHLRPIRKGVVGTVSKIREELEELEDALEQRSDILQLVEASDLYLALERFIEMQFGNTVSMAEVVKMAQITRRAWDTGGRT